MEFERTSRYKTGSLNLTPLIDVLFILIIFFMLTTSFMRVESMELILPSAGKPESKQESVHIYVSANGDMTMGSRKLSESELAESLTRLFEQDPGTRIMLLTAEGVSVQQMVGIMDRIYMMGGKSLFVRKWDRK